MGWAFFKMSWEDFMKRQLTRAVGEFMALQERFEDVGAWDTEARWIFTRFLEALIESDDVTVPTDWDLFTASMDCREATVALTASAWKIADLVRQNRSPEAIDFLEEVTDI